MNNRNRMILRTNIIGIVLNLFLAVAKLVAGILIHSRAVRLDALNGFSDIITSLLSMISAFTASRTRNRAHPFGYGRLEYIFSMFSSALVITMTLRAVYDTVKDLINGNTAIPEYNTAVIILMAVSMAVKLLYGFLTRKAGKKHSATALIMIGTESMGDAIVSASILLSIAISRTAHINLEPWLTLAMSVFLIRTGVAMFRDCANKLLGAKGDPEIYRRVKGIIAKEEEVQNVFYLAIHNYGEELSVGSVDVEVDGNLTVADTTELVRRIRHETRDIGVRLASVGIYGTNVRDQNSLDVWDRVLGVIREHTDIQRGYAFLYNEKRKAASFIVVVNPSAPDEQKAIASLKEALAERIPDIHFEIDSILDF